MALLAGLRDNAIQNVSKTEGNEMPGSILTAEQRAVYERDGYVIVRKLFDDEEIRIIRASMEGDPALHSIL